MSTYTFTVPSKDVRRVMVLDEDDLTRSDVVVVKKVCDEDVDVEELRNLKKKDIAT